MQIVDLFLRMASRMVTPTGPDARLPIIFYHRVLDRRDPLLPDTPDVRLFDVHMSTIARLFTVVSLDEGLQGLRAGTLAPHAVCITFDDGYRDNIETALPVLQKHRLAATFFVASGFLGGGRMFVDTVIESVRRVPAGPLDLRWFGLGTCLVDDTTSRLAVIDKLVADIKYRKLESRSEACERVASLAGDPLPDDLMMTPEQVAALRRAGMSIGGHTTHHPILACLGPREAEQEIVQDRDRLAAIVGSPPRFFAYPNGRYGRDFDDAHVAMVRDAGFDGAVTTDVGCAACRSDSFLLPRQSPWQRSPLRLAAGITRSMRVKGDGRQAGALAAART